MTAVSKLQSQLTEAMSTERAAIEGLEHAIRDACLARVRCLEAQRRVLLALGRSDRRLRHLQSQVQLLLRTSIRARDLAEKIYNPIRLAHSHK